MKIHEITFSPTGGTKRVADCLCGALGTDRLWTDLCAERQTAHDVAAEAGDVAVIAMPVFAGRVPQLAVKRLQRLHGRGMRCVVVAVYGNRAFEDALVEMQDAAGAAGFRVVAAVAAVAEHSIARTYAAGRPDAADCEQLAAFAHDIARKLEATAPDAPLPLPGNRPYKAYSVAGPFPEAGSGCTACGTCSEACPAGAIPADRPAEVDRTLCISCMRCVSVCPVQARGIGAVVAALTERLRPVCSVRRANELFL